MDQPTWVVTVNTTNTLGWPIGQRGVTFQNTLEQLAAAEDQQTPLNIGFEIFTHIDRGTTAIPKLLDNKTASFKWFQSQNYNMDAFPVDSTNKYRD